MMNKQMNRHHHYHRLNRYYLLLLLRLNHHRRRLHKILKLHLRRRHCFLLMVNNFLSYQIHLMLVRVLHHRPNHRLHRCRLKFLLQRRNFM